MKQEQEQEQEKDKRELKKNMAIFATVSSWIVGPIILAVLVGGWLDRKYQTENFFSLTLIAVAFIMTCVGIVREALKAIKNMK